MIEVDFAANLDLETTVLKHNGTIASYSSTSEPTPRVSYYNFAVKGANLRFIQSFFLPHEARLAGEKMILELAQAGKLKVNVGATYALDDIASAHERVERGGRGGTVLKIGIGQ